MKMIKDLIKKNRSCRRFYQEHKVTLKTLKDLVNLARLSASAANLQSLKYILSCNAETNDLIFSCLAWAGYIKNWPGPKEGERPAAYIILLGDTDISKNFWCDHGIASQSILLGAREKGLAGCILAAINRRRLRKILDMPISCKILLVLAIGKPKEKIVIETVDSDKGSSSSENGDKIKYWRDIGGVHHVPKRKLKDIILNCY
jgi:nitroreductase